MKTKSMKTKSLPLPTLLFGLLGITAGVGCSAAPDDGTGPIGSGGAPMGGTGGSNSGGTPSSGGQAATGGSLSGGSSGAGATPATGGTVVSTGGTSTSTGGTSAGGTTTGGTSTGGTSTGGTNGGSTGGAGKGGSATGGTNTNTNTGGTSSGGGGGKGGAGKGGSSTGGAQTGGSGGTGGQVTGTCTASASAGKSVTGTGPHEVVIETNSAQGIKCGTIYRPKDMGGAEKYPIFVWGEGGCSQNGLSNQAAMGEIASWGYFVVADGTPGGTNACQGGQNSKVLLDYVTWAIAENGKSCSAYYQSLQTTKVAADGFSCGGLMAENVSADPRFAAIGITSSGTMSANNSLYDKFHTPFKVMNGGSSDIAYANGLRDYEALASRGIPSVYFSKTSAGHGGDLNRGRGDFNLVNLAWLNWQLKGDLGATGKGFLYGATCKFCTDSGWDYKSANIQ